MRSTFTHHFGTRYAGIALTVLLSAALASSAHASGRGEFNAGYSALMHKNYDRSIALFTEAIESGDLRPTDLALAYHYRGAGYLKAGRDDEAIADFDRALALDASLATAHNDRAIAFRHKGDLARAVADYSEAIRLWPGVYHFHLNRGLTYAADRRYEEAIADYNVALYYKPNHIPALVALGDAHLELGHKDDALAAYRQAMRKKGDFLKVYPGVAAKLTALGAPPAANANVVLGDMP